VTANFFRTNGGDPRGIVSNGIWSQTATSGIATAVAPIVTPVQAQAGAPMGTGMRARR
jgi:hypothetical protein